MNIIFLAIVLIAFLVAAIRQIAWEGIDQSPMELLGAGMIKAAEGSVTLAIGLIGVMALFLGLMKVAEAGGLLTIVARLLRPLMVRLFPEVPADHPAMGAMIMNFSANVLGLGNAATPFGIRAMQELDKLNPHKGTATNAMALFLAINTSSITLLPTGVIAMPIFPAACRLPRKSPRVSRFRCHCRKPNPTRPERAIPPGCRCWRWAPSSPWCRSPSSMAGPSRPGSFPA